MDKLAIATLVVLMSVIRNANFAVQENVLNGAHLKIATAAVRIFLIFYYSGMHIALKIKNDILSYIEEVNHRHYITVLA